MKKIIILLCLLTLSSCSGISKGITQAVLEHKTKDTRKCLILSDEIQGIKDILDSNKYDDIKIMFVHGIGNKQPGTSLPILYNLSNKLGFTTWERVHKNIKIHNELDENTPANLRVLKLSSDDYENDIIFYEFVWSDIAEKHKSILEFDNELNINKQRAEINASIKKFINTAGVDPLVYLGSGRQEILNSTVLAFSIMMKHNWEDLKHGEVYFPDKSKVKDLNKDKFIIITHSLGSKIVIDALQYSAKSLSENNNSNSNQVADTEFDVFMLSNQLPLLQIGRENPEVVGKYEDYCLPTGKHFEKRVIGKTKIYAFSDPNDLLSYSIPQSFPEKYIDARICPRVSNININVASINNPFGIGAIANPLNAHSEYTEDERIISIIANGTDDALVQEKCKIIEIK